MKAVCEMRGLPANLTNEELVRQIEFEFPNLSGALLVMFNRFSEKASDDDIDEDAQCSDPDNVVTCPKCGTELQIEED